MSYHFHFCRYKPFRSQYFLSFGFEIRPSQAGEDIHNGIKDGNEIQDGENVDVLRSPV